MFSASGDTSFDADDEAFLLAALNVEKVVNHSQDGHFNSPDGASDTGTKRKSADMDCHLPNAVKIKPQECCQPVPGTQNPGISTDVLDPLGLNRCLLNKKRTEIFRLNNENVVNSSAVSKCVQMVNLDTAPRTDKPITSKFKFKSNANKSSAFSVTSSERSDSCVNGAVAFLEGCEGIFPAELCDRSEREAKSNSQTGTVQQALESVQQNATASEKTARNMFELSHEDWDSELDLSEVDCSKSPDWKPQIPHCTVTSTVNETHSSDSDQTTFHKPPGGHFDKLRDHGSHMSCMNSKTQSSLNIAKCTTTFRNSTASVEKDVPVGTGSASTTDKQDSFKSPLPMPALKCISPVMVRPAFSVCRTPTPSTSSCGSASPQPAANCMTASRDPTVGLVPKDASVVRTPSGSMSVAVTGILETPEPRKSLLESPSSSKSSSGSVSRRKRKFPGPAGVLPRLKPGVSLDDMDMYKPASPRLPPGGNKQQTPCTDSQVSNSQCFDDRFADGPWQLMKRDLEPQAQKILEEYSIAAILRKAVKKELPRSKVPVLCVSVDQVSIGTPEASVILRDPTGHMKGTVHRHVMTEYPDEMQAGTVLVLRQVGVFSPSGRNYYLNITPSNMVRIYTRSDEEQGVRTKTVTTFSETDFRIPTAVPQTPQQARNSTFATPRASPATPARMQVRYPGTGFRQHRPAGVPSIRPLYPSRTVPGVAHNPRPPTPIRSPYGPENNLTIPRFAPRTDIRAPPGSRYGAGSPVGTLQRPGNPIRQPITTVGAAKTGLSVREPNCQTPPASSSKYTFKKSTTTASLASPRMGMVAPSGGLASKPHIAPGKTTSGSAGSGPCLANQQANPKPTGVDNLWHDDQLDDLLSDLGDEMLTDL